MLQHGLQPDNLLLSGLAGGASAIGIPAFVAFALLPPKPLHGSARLARSGEIAKAKLYKAGAHSILLGRHRGKLLAFNGDLHPFLAAATGTGKGVGFVVPNLLHWQGSAIVLDIKRENYNLTSGYRGRLLGQRVFRFDPLEEHGRTHGFNVLDYVPDGDLRVTDVQTVASILVPNESHDPYWDNVARDLLIGLTLLVLEAGPAMGWPVAIGPTSDQAASAAALGGGERGVSPGAARGAGGAGHRDLQPVQALYPELLQRAFDPPRLDQVGPGETVPNLG